MKMRLINTKIDNAGISNTGISNKIHNAESTEEKMNHFNILILIIEDDKYMNETLCDVLKSEGYNVDATSNAVEAINKIKRSPMKYHLLILDYNLKHLQSINGIDIFNIAKDLNPDVKAVMITAYGSDRSIREKAISQGIDTFLDKPFLITDLVDAVDDLSRDKLQNNHHNMEA